MPCQVICWRYFRSNCQLRCHARWLVCVLNDCILNVADSHGCGHCWLAHTCLCAVTITNVSNTSVKKLPWPDCCWIVQFDVLVFIWVYLLVAHFGTSALLVLLIWKFLTPPTLTFISFITHSHPPYHIHTYYIKSLTKATPSILPTRIDSCPPLIIGMEGHLISIPICHSGTCSHKGLPFDRRPNFSSLDSWRESCHREKTPTLSDGGHEPKNPTHILVREKKCALLACLWLSLPSYDTCSDFFRGNSTYPCHARWLPR